MEALLERDQPVEIVLDGGWQVSARVAAVGPDFVDLGPAGRPLMLPGQLLWCGATVSWRTRIGVAHRHGVLVPRDDGRLRLTPVGDPLRVQRRRFVRVPADLSTAVIASDGRVVTRTQDLSLGGMLLAPADTLALDERVRFALDLGALTISGDGLVVRGTTEGARAVQFSDVQGRVERALSRYVARRQRELIARGGAPPDAPDGG
ncbi:PilZ domain-containing protein [Baekduia soli]|uniref:PilZ domain-containing protein n=1 Tax=Baekduia soli TaxID=496014 RepID=UPI0016527D2A|nr:PilZ domain-containing protein [Baekduia soli]